MIYTVDKIAWQTEFRMYFISRDVYMFSYKLSAFGSNVLTKTSCLQFNVCK